MLRRLAAVVFLLPLAFAQEASSVDGNCRVEGLKIECQCDNSRNYSTPVLGGYPNCTELTIKDCELVELGPGFFIQDLPLEKITFRNIEQLVIGTTFSSQLAELHLDRVGLDSLSGDSFSGETRLRELRVHNSTIGKITSDTFEYVTVGNAHFEHVTFKGLDVDALAFTINVTDENKKEHTNLFFNGCRFPALDVTPISVGSPGKIKFVNNILDCDSLAQTYQWVDAMVGDQKQNNHICQILDENFCGTRGDGNKLFRRLLASGLLTDKIGISLKETCPRAYQDYVDSTTYFTNPYNTGWTAQADVAALSMCFVAVWLSM